MHPIKPVLKLFVFDYKSGYLIFWSILGGIALLNIFLVLAIPGMNFGMSSNFAVYLYMAFAGFFTVKETFPYTLGMGGTRRHYYLGVILGGLGLVALQALSLSVYLVLFESVSKWLNLQDRFEIYHIKSTAFLNSEWITMFLFDFIIALAAFTLFTLVGAVNYRFGWIPLLISSSIIVLMVMTPSVRGALETLFDWVIIDPMLRFAMLIIGQSLICLAGLWLVLRRAPILSAGKR